MPSRPYAQSTSPEQSKPAAGEAPPHRYGTPTSPTAIAAARSPTVGSGTQGFGACCVGVCPAAALAGVPTQAQAKTIAESANVSRGLRKGVGTEERERRAAKHLLAQP
jgi:hypothetical protein